MTGAPRDEEHKKILAEYDNLLQIADDKVQLANGLYGVVQRFVSKLDQELLKFKIELEADNAGITEVLERRSKELDSSSSTRNDRRSQLHHDGRHQSSSTALTSSHHQTYGFNHSLDMDSNFDLSNFACGIDSFDTFGPSSTFQQPATNSASLAALLQPGSPAAYSEDMSVPSSAAPSSVSGDRVCCAFDFCQFIFVYFVLIRSGLDPVKVDDQAELRHVVLLEGIVVEAAPTACRQCLI